MRYFERLALIFSIAIFSGVLYLYEPYTYHREEPVPTDIAEKKKKRKSLKKERRKFFELMHMTDGTDDWRLIEQDNSDRRRIRNRDEVEMLISRGIFDRDDVSLLVFVEYTE